MIISKEAFRANFITLEQVLSHQFFNEFAANFKKFQSENAENLKKALATEIGGKESIASAVHKTEQRLKEEQKLVKILSVKIWF